MSCINTEPHYDKPRISEFAQQMTDARIARNWTQMEVAVRLGVPNAGRIAEWEQGNKKPSEEWEIAIRSLLEF